MIVFKYKSLAKLKDGCLDFLCQIILENKIWCGSPTKFNDDNEFLFDLDCTPTDRTCDLLARAIAQFRPNSMFPPSLTAKIAVKEDIMGWVLAPIIQNLVCECRNEIGVTCFSRNGNSPVLWERYGGSGNGVCVEMELPDSLVNRHYHHVTYLPKKTFPLDEFLMSTLSNPEVNYRNILLTKELFWEPESEVRYVCKNQNIKVSMGGVIKKVMLGPSIPNETFDVLIAKVKSHCLANSIPIERQTNNGSALV